MASSTRLPTKPLVLTLIASVACVALLAPGALAKGPVEASLAGPGLEQPIRFGGWEDDMLEERGAPLMTFAEATGFFPAAFGQSPDPMLDSPPKGELGPRYTATYDLGGRPGWEENILVQDVYPYARPNPVTYMRAGQRFYGGMRTEGGWFVGVSPSAPPLLDQLVAAGLPRTPPRAGEGSPFPWAIVGPLTAVAVLALGTLAIVVVRRRPHPAV
jgi:hypothetical protein